MKGRDTFVENALDSLFGEAFGRAFSGTLEALGINPNFAGIFGLPCCHGGRYLVMAQAQELGGAPLGRNQS